MLKDSIVKKVKKKIVKDITSIAVKDIESIKMPDDFTDENAYCLIFTAVSLMISKGEKPNKIAEDLHNIVDCAIDDFCEQLTKPIPEEKEKMFNKKYLGLIKNT